MSKQTPETPKQSQLFQPDPEHLKMLQDFAVERYKQDIQCDIEGRECIGALEQFDIEHLHCALDKYHELVSAGYTPSDKYLPVSVPGPFALIIMYLLKPEEVQEAEISAIRANIEAAYLEQLSTDKNLAIEKEIESQLASERRKVQQAKLESEAKAEQAMRDRVRAEVLAALGGGQ
ncbi:hypothetical protein IMW75_03285 [Pseudomonas gregormendelii]|uniref:Uncharacterized protein n=1 Tax=Pseudomonas gregormendelii TaxID=1628277 RepID=A0ABS3ABU9_9PSED|nr:hypothetical protein [Pseudomonas gregormendelii]MBN3964308.1 hypothetical protein [Pseudomonas gregormendelii]